MYMESRSESLVEFGKTLKLVLKSLTFVCADLPRSYSLRSSLNFEKNLESLNCVFCVILRQIYAFGGAMKYEITYLLFSCQKKNHIWSQATQPGCISGVRMSVLSVSVWHVLSMPPCDLNLVQIPGKMPPNVKPNVIHYFMSKEKNFTLNQPWRLSWHLLSPSSHVDSFNTLRLMCCHVTKKALKTERCLHDNV